MIGQIKQSYGYSHDEVLWGQPWSLFVLESADAPRYVHGARPVPVLDNADDIRNALGARIKSKVENQTKNQDGTG